MNLKKSSFVKNQEDVLLVKLALLSLLHVLTLVAGFPPYCVMNLWTQQNQFTHEQLPFSDSQFILTKHDLRSSNHSFREKSKNPRGLVPNSPQLQVGDLVHLVSDKDKSCACDRYIVISTEPPGVS